MCRAPDGQMDPRVRISRKRILKVSRVKEGSDGLGETGEAAKVQNRDRTPVTATFSQSHHGNPEGEV